MSAVRPHHVGVSVADLEQSIAWYQTYLGFSLEKTGGVPEDDGRMAMLVSEGGFRVELSELAGAAALPDERRHPATDLRTQGVKHVAYKVQLGHSRRSPSGCALSAPTWCGTCASTTTSTYSFCATTPAISSCTVEPVEPADDERT